MRAQYAFGLYGPVSVNRPVMPSSGAEGSAGPVVKSRIFTEYVRICIYMYPYAHTKFQPFQICQVKI